MQAKFLLLLLAVFMSVAARSASQSAPYTGYYPMTARPSNKIVIVFVHGIFGDSEETWKSKNGHYWPEMIYNNAPFKNRADIYLFGFYSPYLGTALGIKELARKMSESLERDHVLVEHKHVIFLCHSMGGLITKAFLLNEHVDATKIGFIYFFATPHEGSYKAELLSIFSRNPELVDMRPIDENPELQKVDGDWMASVYSSRVQRYCAYETLNYLKLGIIVPYGSATRGCNHLPLKVNADHSSIVKPTDEVTDPYKSFLDAFYEQFPSVLPAASKREPSVFRRLIPTLPLRPTYKEMEVNLEVPCGTRTTGQMTKRYALILGMRRPETDTTLQNPLQFLNSWVRIVRTTGKKVTIEFSLEPSSPSTCTQLQAKIKTIVTDRTARQ
jgi:hypothetical protein